MGGATVRAKETVRVIAVLLAFIVTAYVPAVVPGTTLMDVVHEPEPESGTQKAGEKVMTGPPDTIGETAELKVVAAVMDASLFTGSTFTVIVERTLEAEPTIACPDVGDAERVKS